MDSTEGGLLNEEQELVYELQICYEEQHHDTVIEHKNSLEEALAQPNQYRKSSLGLAPSIPLVNTNLIWTIHADIVSVSPKQLKEIISKHRKLHEFDLHMFSNKIEGTQSLHQTLIDMKILSQVRDYKYLQVNVFEQKQAPAHDGYTPLFMRRLSSIGKAILAKGLKKLKQHDAYFQGKLCIVEEIDSKQFKVVEKETNSVLLWSQELTIWKLEAQQIITLNGEIKFIKPEQFETFSSHMTPPLPSQMTKAKTTGDVVYIKCNLQTFVNQTFGKKTVWTPAEVALKHLSADQEWLFSIKQKQQFNMTSIQQFIVEKDKNSNLAILTINFCKQATPTVKIQIDSAALDNLLSSIRQIAKDSNNFQYANLFIIEKDDFDQYEHFQLHASAYDWLDSSPESKSPYGIDWTISNGQQKAEIRVIVLHNKIVEEAVLVIIKSQNEQRPSEMSLVSKKTQKTIQIIHQDVLIDVFCDKMDNRQVFMVSTKGNEISIVFQNIFQKHLFMQLLDFKSQAFQQDNIRIKLVTWNQGDSSQLIFKQNPELIIRDASACDIVALTCQECQLNMISTRIQDLTTYMTAQGFLQFPQPSMQWQMYTVIYVKKELRREIQRINIQAIAKGTFVGNKGCVTINFSLRDRTFHFIGGHLKHGQDAVEKRNKMCAEHIQELKSQKRIYGAVECDSSDEFTFIFGDLNYRLDTTYEAIVDKINDAISKKKLDQLTNQFEQGHYPEYKEGNRPWLPTYKMSNKKQFEYVNKKSQAPSYCDRIMFKNNSGSEIQIEDYTAMHDVLGSDHRPVALTIKVPLPRYQYADLTNNLTTGVIEMVKLNLQFKNIRNSFELADPKLIIGNTIQLLVVFHEIYLDFDAKILHSAVIQADVKENLSLNFEQFQLPILKTPLNSWQLLRERSLSMIIWGKPLNVANHSANYHIIGQTNFRFKEVNQQSGNTIHNAAISLKPICFRNYAQGQASIIFNYHVV